MIKKPIFIFLIVIWHGLTWAQVTSVSDGNWNNPSTWNPSVVPDFNSGTIQIQHNVSVPNGFSVMVDEVIVQSGGKLTVLSGGTLQVVDGSGTDLQLLGSAQMDVYGSFICSHGATLAGTTAANTTFRSGSLYRHLYTTTEGAIPLATWQSGSTVEIAGYNNTMVASASGNWSQSFSNVVINCTALNNRGVLFQGLLNNMENLTIQSTGNNGWVELTRGQTATIYIARDLTVSGSSRLYLTSGGNVVVYIGRDFLFTSTSVFGSYTATTGVCVLNIGRDFIMNASGGGLRVAVNAGAGQTTFNINRNFSILAGRLEESAPNGLGIINFVAPGDHIFQNSGQILNTFNYYVGPAATLNLGTSALTGDGTFTLDGTIIVGSTSSSGAISTSSTAGNIQLPLANRIYNPNSTIIYGGTSVQAIGAAHPSGSGVHTVINNSAGVNMISDLTFGGNVTLQAGSLNMGTYKITMNGGNWLTNGGTLNYGTSGQVTFGSTTNVGGTTIPAFRHVIVSGTVNLTNHINIFGDLTIQPGASFNTSSFELRFTGNPNQTLSANGASINRITINKTGGSLILSSQLDLTGTLQFISPTNLITNNFLTLRSTNDQPAQDGNIAALPAGATISGNVTVERYFQTADNVDRFISSPISNASVAQLQDDFAVTGNFTGTSFPCTGCLNNGASLRWYDETVTGPPFKNGYKPFPAPGGSNSETLVPGVGYDTYMWNGVTPIVWDVTGTINRGTIHFSVSHTPSSPPIPTDDGWNLVGNPYPSAIQWNDGPGWSRTNIDPTVWVWDVVGKIWRSYNYNTMLGNLTNGIIALGQAFWVYVPNPGTATMSINESAKSTVGSGSYYRTGPAFTYPYVRIHISKDQYYDDAFILWHDDATPAFDSGIDAPKLRTGQEYVSLSLVGENRLYGHYALNDLTSYLEIPLNIQGEEDVYQLSVEVMNFPTGLYLVDRLQRLYWPLEKVRNITFHLRGGSENFRFAITNQPDVLVAPVQQEAVSVEIYPNPSSDYFRIATDEEILFVELVSVSGLTYRPVFTKHPEQGTTSVDIRNLQPGVYIVKLFLKNSVHISRILKH